ncbi:MAG: PAS domain S-box protein [Bacteroidota bacterium]
MTKDKKPYRILIIEDNPGDYLIVEDLLLEQILNPSIAQVNNFKEASALLSQGDNLFDVILLDLTLPDKSGQQLINEILTLAPGYPIIILTGYTDMDFSIKSISRNISDYLLKDDLNATILYKSIIYAIERKKYISELKKSEERYSDLFRLSPQPMWVYDMETFRFVQVNKAAIENYGYSEMEFLNMTILDIRPESEIPKLKGILRSEDAHLEAMYRGRFRHLKKSGDIIEVEIYSTPILIGDKSFKSVIAIDITDKILYEDRLINAILRTQEEERYEIGSELHDNVCQILATSQISLDKLKEALPPEKMKWYNYSREYLELALTEIRNLSHRMAPAFFTDTTVQEAFERLLHSFDVDGRYKVVLTVHEAVKKHLITIDAQLNLYRILQEQLRNIVKHAKATRIEVDVTICKDRLTMTVRDNGIGFDVENQKTGIGMTNMKRRAAFFSGEIGLASTPGIGSTITVSIPLKRIIV